MRITKAANNNNNTVIIGATELVTGGLRKNLEAIPGKYSIDSLQRQPY